MARPGSVVTIAARINAANNPFLRMLREKYPRGGRWELIPILNRLEESKLEEYEDIVSTISSKQNRFDARLTEPFQRDKANKKGIGCFVESSKLSRIYEELRRNGLKDINLGKRPRRDGPSIEPTASSEFQPFIFILNHITKRQADIKLKEVLEMLRLCRNEPGTVSVEGLCLRQELDSGPRSPKEGSPWKMFPFIGGSPNPPQANIAPAFKTPDAPSVEDMPPSDKSG
jgi:hypothetical protein